jgi:hypothetical protein
VICIDIRRVSKAFLGKTKQALNAKWEPGLDLGSGKKRH